MNLGLIAVSLFNKTIEKLTGKLSSKNMSPTHQQQKHQLHSIVRSTSDSNMFSECQILVNDKILVKTMVPVALMNAISEALK